MNLNTGLINKQWFRNLTVFCLFLLIALVVFWNSLGNSFQFDDEMVVTYNRNIRSLDNFSRFLTKPEMISADPHQAVHYRPIVVISYALNYAIGGYNPTGYHLVNIILHAGAAFLIFLIVGAMLGSRQLAALAAGLIFLVHPFNAEAVNYITARFSIMSSLFYLLGFYFWVRYRQVPATAFYIATFLAFIAGMLSKEIVVTLPAVLWLYDLYFVWGKKGLLNLKNYLIYLPFAFMVIIPYFVVRLLSHYIGNVLPHFKWDLFTQFLTELPVLVKHWQMFFSPYPLTIAHIINLQKTVWSFPVIYSGVVLISYILIAVILSRIEGHCWKVLSFFMFWFFIVLLPSTVIPLNALFQENRGYLAIISFAIMGGILFDYLRKTKIQSAAIVFLVLLIIIYSVVTVKQNRVWKDELSLWTDAAQKYPNSFAAYTALGIAYRRAKMYNQSLDASRKALILGGDDNFFAHANLGEIYLEEEKWDMAAKELELAIKGYSYKAKNHNDLGVAYFKLGNLDHAELEYQEAISLDKYYYQPWFNLGTLYLKKGKTLDAIKAYNNAISINPLHITSMLKLGEAFEGVGKKDDAIRYYNMVLQKSGGVNNIYVHEARNRLSELGELKGNR